MDNSIRWSVIEDCPRYEVSNNGQVRNRHTGRILRAASDKNGYNTLVLHADDGVHTKKVHRLVAQYFLKPDETRDQVNHKDGNKKNNCASNLEWCTRSENTRHAYANNLFKANIWPAIEAHTKIKREWIPDILQMRKNGMYLKDIAKVYGVAISTIGDICKEGGA